MSHPTSTATPPATPATQAPATPAPAGRAPIATAPCYCCGSRLGVPAGPAYWGFFLPGILDHVQCVDCPVTYNAQTGQSNDPAIVALHVVYAVALVGILVGLFLFAR